jgi:hypothetical protein
MIALGFGAMGWCIGQHPYLSDPEKVNELVLKANPFATWVFHQQLCYPEVQSEAKKAMREEEKKALEDLENDWRLKPSYGSKAI